MLKFRNETSEELGIGTEHFEQIESVDEALAHEGQTKEATDGDERMLPRSIVFKEDQLLGTDSPGICGSSLSK